MVITIRDYSGIIPAELPHVKYKFIKKVSKARGFRHWTGGVRRDYYPPRRCLDIDNAEEVHCNHPFANPSSGGNQNKSSKNQTRAPCNRGAGLVQ